MILKLISGRIFSRISVEIPEGIEGKLLTKSEQDFVKKLLGEFSKYSLGNAGKKLVILKQKIFSYSCRKVLDTFPNKFLNDFQKEYMENFQEMFLEEILEEFSTQKKHRRISGKNLSGISA